MGKRGSRCEACGRGKLGCEYYRDRSFVDTEKVIALRDWLTIDHREHRPGYTF